MKKQKRSAARRRHKPAPVSAENATPKAEPEHSAGASEAPSPAGAGVESPAGQPDQVRELDQAIAAGEAARPEPPPPPPQLDPHETEVVHKVSEFVEAADAEEQSGKGGEHAQLLQELTAEDVADFLKLGFSLVAFRRGDHWVLSEQEADHIGRWVKKSIERHGVEWVAKWLPDIMAGALLGYAIVRRVEVDTKIAKQKKDAAGSKAAGGAK